MEYNKKIFSRVLRKESTPHEAKVWELLRNRGLMHLKFRRQHVIEGFVVDFYCNQLKFAIEIDGGIHNRQRDYDELRQNLIESKGVHFIRISNDEIDSDMDAVISRLRDAIKKRISKERG